MNAISAADLAIAQWANGLLQNAGTFLTPVLRFVSFLGDGGWAMIAAAAAMLLFRRTRKPATAALFAMIAGLLITNALLKNLFARQRPFEDPGSVYYIFWVEAGSLAASGYSFPSGHTTAAMAFACALFAYGKKSFSWTIFLLPLAMGLSRIYFAVHFASDVAAGFIAGGCAAALSCTAMHFISKARLFKTFFDLPDITEYFKRRKRR